MRLRIPGTLIRDYKLQFYEVNVLGVPHRQHKPVVEPAFFSRFQQNRLGIGSLQASSAHRRQLDLRLRR